MIGRSSRTPEMIFPLDSFAICSLQLISEETANMEIHLSLPYIGTAGWSYPHWNGVVYPKNYAGHPLELLSAYLDLVEINSSFYQFLKPELVRLWIKKVEDNPRFLFTAKLHQKFTHARIVEDADVTAFKEGLA